MKNSLRHVTDYVPWVAICFLLAWTLAPIVSLVLTSVTPKDIPISAALRLPEKMTLQNYADAFGQGIGACMLNSFIVASVVVLLGCILGVPTAYGFSRHSGRLVNVLFLFLLVVRAVPPITFIVPVYVLSLRLGLLRTRYDIIVIHLFWNLPLAIWLLRSFFDLLPREMEEAALVDGASNLQVLFHIVTPLVKPGIAVTAVFLFVFSFLEYLYGSVLTSTEIMTMPVKLASFSYAHTLRWRMMTAAALVSTLPMVAVYALGQRHIVRGLTFGAVK